MNNWKLYSDLTLVLMLTNSWARSARHARTPSLSSSSRLSWCRRWTCRGRRRWMSLGRTPRQRKRSRRPRRRRARGGSQRVTGQCTSVRRKCWIGIRKGWPMVHRRLYSLQASLVAFLLADPTPRLRRDGRVCPRLHGQERPVRRHHGLLAGRVHGGCYRCAARAAGPAPRVAR